MSIPFNKLPGSKGFLRVSLSVFFCNKTFRPIFLILPFKHWKSLRNHLIPKKVKIGVYKSSSFLPWGLFKDVFLHLIQFAEMHMLETCFYCVTIFTLMKILLHIMIFQCYFQLLTQESAKMKNKIWLKKFGFNYNDDYY